MNVYEFWNVDTRFIDNREKKADETGIVCDGWRSMANVFFFLKNNHNRYLI